MALSPELKRIVKGANARDAKRAERRAEFDRRQVALLIKAVEIAAKSSPELAPDFRFAAGYAAGRVNLDDREFEAAKELALTI